MTEPPHYVQTHSQQRYVLTRGALIGLLVSWAAMAAIAVWLWTTSATVANLNRTDRIACQFLNADAFGRVQSAENTRQSQTAAEAEFIRQANTFLVLFNKVPKSKRSPSLEVFKAYIIAERDLVASIRDGTVRNVAISKHLAKVGMSLADQLHC